MPPTAAAATPTTAIPPDQAAPATSATHEEGRLPMRPVHLSSTASQLSRAERATTHSGVASRGWRLRRRDESAGG